MSAEAPGEEAESRHPGPSRPAVPPILPSGGLVEVALFRVRQWSGILSAYFSAQSVAQLLGVGAGILFVRTMSREQFALYTLAFSVVSFFHFLTDLGSTGSLVYFRRRAAEAGEDFAAYTAAVLSLRRWVFLAGALVVIVAFPFIASAEGYDPLLSVPAALAIAAVVWFQLVSSIRLLVLRLHHHYGASYRAELVGGGVRLALAGLLVAVAFLDAWLAVATGAIAAAAVAWVARSPESVPRTSAALGPYRRRVLRYLLPTLPSALYYSIQGPLIIWLAATFSGTDTIAEVGALGRLGMVVGLFSGLTGIIFLPRLARVTDDAVYHRRYLQFGAFLAAIAAGLLAVAAFFPEGFLFVIGPRYSGLHYELLLTVAGAGLTLLGGYAVAVNLARSWNRWQGVAVAGQVVVQGALVVLVPLATTAGVLTFNLLSAAFGLTTQVVINLLGFSRPGWVRW